MINIKRIRSKNVELALKSEDFDQVMRSGGFRFEI